MFSFRESTFYLLPLIVCNILPTDLVIKKAKIGYDITFIFKNIRCSNTFVEKTFGILDKKIIQILVTAIKCCEFGIESKFYKFHLFIYRW